MLTISRKWACDLIWPTEENTDRCCVHPSHCTVVGLLPRAGLFDYLFQSLYRCGFRLQYEGWMQLFVMSHWCEWDEKWIHFKLIVENISEKEGGTS